jgi:uncharacterized membrane protein YphA (DoxX/SURF4 family)
MDTALLITRFLLALVFVVAGVAKLADRKGSRQAITDFGLPTALATPVGILLPLAELAVAAILIPTSTAWWGAVGALALLLLFVTGIAANLARGKKPECHCFGQLHSAPAGWKTLLRNGALAALRRGIPEFCAGYPATVRILGCPLQGCRCAQASYSKVIAPVVVWCRQAADH